MDQNDMRALWNDSEQIRAGACSALDLSRDAAERAMDSYETEYEMVANVNPRTGQTSFYLPSTYRAMQAAHIRRDKKRALRRELTRLGITGVTIR